MKPRTAKEPTIVRTVFDDIMRYHTIANTIDKGAIAL